MSEWIEWKGGECPVHPSTIVRLRFRDGELTEDEEACWSSWEHIGKPYDIISYRIVKDEKA